MAVLLEVHHRTARGIDRQVGEVRAAEPLQLGIEIGEVAAVQQRVVTEVDARHDVLRAISDLLGFGEEVVDVAIERERTDDADRHVLLGDEFGRVEMVEGKLVGGFLIEQLDAEIPLREVTALDRLPKIAAMIVGIGAADLDRLVPQHRLEPLARLPVELDEGRPAFRVHQAEAVDAEALHRAEGAGDRATGHDPHDHVPGFRGEAGEIPEIVVCGLRLGERPVGLLLGRMDQIGELDGILDEEHRDVVADDVPVALLRVHLDGEAAHVARQIARALVARYR